MELIVGRPTPLVVDMQHDFLNEGVPLEAAGGRDINPAVARMVAAAREAGIPVIFNQEAHRPDQVDLGRDADPGMGADCWYQADSRQLPLPEYCVQGTSGIEIVDEVGTNSATCRSSSAATAAFLGLTSICCCAALGCKPCSSPASTRTSACCGPPAMDSSSTTTCGCWRTARRAPARTSTRQRC